ncbi:MAG: hypothetical protein H0V29_11840 [Thermoleophilaceae bacterium]|nr:hypothetical protein [Thermoleophilaceae bacterium]
MRGRGILALCALAVAIAPGAAYGQGDNARYELANDCWAMKSKSNGKFLAKAGTGYRTSGGTPAEGEPLYLKPTELGKYLLYTRGREFVGASNGKAQTAAQPSEATIWTIDGTAGALKLVNGGTGLGLAGDEAVLVDSGAAESFSFEKASNCSPYPEIETNVSGTPSSNPIPYNETRGFADFHMHMMAFEYFGGGFHCGKPWDRFGVEYALVDCPDHGPGGAGAAAENAFSSGGTTPTHDTVGWPTFNYWPKYNSYTHELSYYKWTERAWASGLRLYVNLLVDNAPLCEVYPVGRRNSCNEMDSVRLQAKRLRELEGYIDAQAGGPGKGYLRIVEDPFEARRVINQGKLAVIMGIEISKLFDCGIYNDQPDPGCDTKSIDRQLDEVYRMGVRGMEIVNKYDNALSGVAGDSGSAGVVTGTGNKYETGDFFDLKTCTDEDTDRGPTSTPGTEQDQIFGATLNLFLPGGTAPVYPPGPVCNTKGLTVLGEHLVRRMIEKGMMIDPDHMSVLARRQLLNITESKNYSGVLTSHSWSTNDAYRRIANAGGAQAPYAGNSTSFAKEWKERKAMANSRYLFGMGYGADANGLGAQGAPRKDAAKNPVKYPFKSFDGAVTIDKQQSGSRVYDINKDGVAHYGLYADWVEDLRMIAGQEIVDDMAKGAESYLQTWERAVGIPGPGCRSARGKFTKDGLFGLKLNRGPDDTLRASGQPATRQGRTWTWCVDGNRNTKSRAAATYTPEGTVALVSSNAKGHRAKRVEVGSKARGKVLRRSTRKFGRGVLISRNRKGAKTVYGLRKGRVSYIAVATRSASKNKKTLAGYLKVAGLR